MNINYLKILKQNWQAMILFTAALVILVTIISLLQPFEYRAKVNLLIIQKQTQTLDAYAAARAAERMAANLATVIKTDSFFKKVIGANGAIDISWPVKESQRREMCQEMITAKALPESGMLTVNVFYRDADQAKIVAQTVANVLSAQGADYHGGGDSVLIKIVDPAIVSNYPVRPNIILNLAGAVILGLVLAGAFFAYQTQKRFDILKIKQDEETEELPGHNKRIATREMEREVSGRIKTMLEDPFVNKYYFEQK